ncbi:uncharacterized protein C5L36_0E03720 [Pichia kudriavzevii]|uniref:Protein SVP26 n=2 Tax=Pichia kudriavzevii TaxID=4909 RepID=A0A1V2L9J3_PICKU|nr:uncharacterized protein C5L36_0E03720 [Pichia kudriavzevii]AWU78315.1 hypothetical protein C5L36_0E03720 [Pichia kudriavzevii]ONH68454.1 Protein SVP26 [Pichia kudriavzevii]
MFIQILAIAGAILGFIVATLSIAAGLYYISEIIEENLSFTKRFLNRSILTVSSIMLLLVVFDNFPIKLTLFSLASNLIYYQNLKHFPNIHLSNITFIASAVLAFLNHYLWFNHFNNPYIPSIDERLAPDFVPPHYPSFTEIASFFAICIWLVPFALFISISSNENALPLAAAQTSDHGNNKAAKSANLVRSIINKALLNLSSLSSALGFNFKFSRSNSTNPNELYI